MKNLNFVEMVSDSTNKITALMGYVWGMQNGVMVDIDEVTELIRDIQKDELELIEMVTMARMNDDSNTIEIPSFMRKRA